VLRVTVDLAPDEAAALEQFRRAHRQGALSSESAARLLIRDELIRMGILKLPGDNRARGAKRTAR
jgi:hypothetical protein